MYELVEKELVGLPKEKILDVINYIQFLKYKSANERKENDGFRERNHASAEHIRNAFDEFQTIIGEDKGWENEEDMLKDMANFRKERLGL